MMRQVLLAYDSDEADEALIIHEKLRHAQIATHHLETEDAIGLKQALEFAFCAVLIVSRKSLRSRRLQAQFKVIESSGTPLFVILTEDFKSGATFYKALAKHSVLRTGGQNEVWPDALLDQVRTLHERACPVVSIMNFKGGVGKTTVSAQVMGALQKQYRNRVLLVDLDPQYNLTQFFIPFETIDRASLADQSIISLFEPGLLHSEQNPSPGEAWDDISRKLFIPLEPFKLANPILDTEELPGRLDIIAGQFEISKYAFASDEEGLELAAENFCASIERYRRHYDLIVIDTNPTATFLTRLALSNANHIIAPVRADAFSLRGVQLLSRLMMTSGEADNRADLHILFNGVRPSEPTQFETDVRDGLFDKGAGMELSKRIFESAVPRSQNLVAAVDRDEARPWRRLAAHYARGGGVGQLRRSLEAVSTEIGSTIGLSSATR